MTRYVLYPGYVSSQHDGQRHFIGGPRLARLYGVDLAKCVWGDVPTYREKPGDIPLYPRADGDYTIPETTE